MREQFIFEAEPFEFDSYIEQRDERGEFDTEMRLPGRVQRRFFKPPARVVQPVCTSQGRLAILDGFDFDSDRLKSFHETQLNRIAQCVVASQSKPKAIRLIRLVGHTDAVGADAYNLGLGRRRAEQVKQHLIKQIKKLRPGLVGTLSFQVETRGESQQLSGDPARNRRVEIHVTTTVPVLTCRLPALKNRELVAWLQRALNRTLGTRLTEDGLYGVQTRSAVRSFQQRRGVGTVGVLDGVTQRALIALSGLPAPCKLQDDAIVICPDTISCPEGAFSGSVQTGGITFRFCWSTLSFNNSPGNVIPLSQSRLRFSCHGEAAFQTPDQNCLMLVPAWEYEAAVIAQGPGLGKPSDWEFGFVQTVRSSRWIASYSGGAARVCDINDVRDALSVPGTADRPPWFMPRVAVQELCAGSNATMEDSPRLDIPITHPAKQTLQEVCFIAKFEVWLAAKRRTARSEQLVLLGSRLIEIDRMWRLRSQGDPTSASSWLPFGGQKQTDRKAGSVSTRPIVSGATASQKQAGCFRDETNVRCKEPSDFPGGVFGTPRCNPRPPKSE